jgi:hypothetical protein
MLVATPVQICAHLDLFQMELTPPVMASRDLAHANFWRGEFGIAARDPDKKRSWDERIEPSAFMWLVFL